MDLRPVVGPAATDDERAAVDSVLGPPESGWQGGARTHRDGHVAFGGHAARGRRHLLLPVLHAVQDRMGHISRGALDYACTRLTVPPAEAYGVASFYALLRTEPLAPTVVHVCDDIACQVNGAEALCAQLTERYGAAGSTAAAADGTGVTWVRSPCLGHCERAPAALIQQAGEQPRRTTVAPATAGVLAAALDGSQAAGPNGGLAGGPVTGTPAPQASGGAAAQDSIDPAPQASDDPVPQASDDPTPQASDDPVPQAAGDRAPLRLLRLGRRVDPGSLDSYRAAGGYQALRRAIGLGPGGVIREVKEAKLLGRGGAAFPAGVKWEAVAANPARPHYVVGNADESETGTFKDRVLMEQDPFSLIEALTIMGFACAAEHGYLYIRGEYPLAEQRLHRAAGQARARGLLGADVMGAGFAFDIEIRRGAGAYIAGEETALFNSIEGKRAEPRNKPPFPAQSGLFGAPTAINNVETLLNVPEILRIGGEAFAATGTEGSTGTRLLCVSGCVTRPGLYEMPSGTTLRTVIGLAGGVRGGRPLQAVLLGGAAGSFVGPDLLDVPLSFEDLRAVGATLGSGVVLVLDDTVSVTGVCRRIARFFRDESCGQCVPCRVGTARQEELLGRLASTRPLGPLDQELTLLGDIGTVMRDASICGLGQTAGNAIASAARLGLITADGVSGADGAGDGGGRP